MKKIIFALAAVALTLAACDKANTNVPEKDYSKVKVNLTVSMPEPLTKTFEFSQKNASDPLGGMSVTWGSGNRVTLIVFQGDESGWKDNFVYQIISVPSSAAGTTTCDLSAAMSPLDLSGFDNTKNLKYMLITGSFNEYWKEITCWNGLAYISSATTLSGQIRNYMMAETDVKEVPFPSGDLTLKGELHWITSVLAVQFDIDSEADITYGADSYLVFYLSGKFYIDCYTPIDKYSTGSAVCNCPIYFESAAKLSDALDANNCRYFPIPADNMTKNSSQKIGGSSINFKRREGGSDFGYTSTGTLKDITIEAGKVYGIKVKVTDSNSDGKPEFTKM